MSKDPYPCRQELWPVDHSSDPVIQPVMGLAHVAVNGTTPGIQSGPVYHDGLEWHFYIDKGPGLPQDIVTQHRLTCYQADANFKANGFWLAGVFCGALSFESEGTGDEPWTDDQVTAIVWLFRLMNKIDGIPLVLCPGPYSPGIGYHRLFNEWNNPYHSCPGDQKVWQFRNIIIPALSAPIVVQEEEVVTPCAWSPDGKWFVMAVRGLDNNVWIKRFNNETGNYDPKISGSDDWFPLPGGGNFAGSPGISFGPNRLDVTVMGQDKAVYHQWCVLSTGEWSGKWQNEKGQAK